MVSFLLRFFLSLVNNTMSNYHLCVLFVTLPSLKESFIQTIIHLFTQFQNEALNISLFITEIYCFQLYQSFKLRVISWSHSNS